MGRFLFSLTRVMRVPDRGSRKTTLSLAEVYSRLTELNGEREQGCSGSGGQVFLSVFSFHFLVGFRL
jgi:hypothetical protein